MSEYIPETFTEQEMATLSDEEKAARAYALAEHRIATCDGEGLNLGGWRTKDAILGYLGKFPHEIQRLNSLQSLDASYTSVSDLSPLSGLSSLQSLRVASRSVSDLSPLSGLSSLQSLGVSDTSVSDLSPLSGLSSLQSLSVISTSVSDLSPLSGLLNLQSLNASFTNISNLSPLSGLSSLQSLDVSDTSVSDLSPLANLSNIESITCSRMQITRSVPSRLWYSPVLTRFFADDSQIAGFPKALFSEHENHLPAIRQYLQDHPAEKEEAPKGISLSLEMQRRVDEYQAQSDVAFIAHEEKLHKRDAPLNTPPKRINPPELLDRLTKQKTWVEKIISNLQITPVNFRKELFLPRLTDYQTAIETKITQLNPSNQDHHLGTDYDWETFDDYFRGITVFQAHYIPTGACEPMLQDELETLLQRHKNLEDLMRPDQQGRPNENILDESDVTEKQEMAIEEMASNPNILDNLNGSASKLLQRLWSEWKRITFDQDLSKEQKKQEKIRVREKARKVLAAMYHEAVPTKKQVFTALIVGLILKIFGL